MFKDELFIELVEITTEDDKIIFTQRAREIIAELAGWSKGTAIYKRYKGKEPDWVKTATAEDIYMQILERIGNAPTKIHMSATIMILTPILWEKIQEEDGYR